MRQYYIRQTSGMQCNVTLQSGCVMHKPAALSYFSFSFDSWVYLLSIWIHQGKKILIKALKVLHKNCHFHCICFELKCQYKTVNYHKINKHKVKERREVACHGYF